MESKLQLSRRDLFKSTLATGLAGTAPMMMAATAEAAEPSTAIKPLTGKMTYEQVRDRAREILMPRCFVCPECDGRGPCIGQVPGFGGMGANRGFQANYESLAAVRLNARLVHDVKVPDTSIDFFGTKLSLPLISAPTGGTTYNMGGKLTEEQFVEAICGGCTRAGTLGGISDGIGDPLPVFEKRVFKLKELGVKAIVGLKPRRNKDIIERMRLAEQAGVVALTIDLDSAGRAARATKGQTVEPKTLEQLKELVKACPLPLLFKGIMTVEDAEMCLRAGAVGIVVSNHGGRTLADTPGVASVLPRIADFVNDRAFLMADGTVARGTDLEKYVAMGAKCCLSGRHLIRAAHGGLSDGVKLFVDRLRSELAVSMTLTGAQRVSAITRKMIVLPGQKA